MNTKLLSLISFLIFFSLNFGSTLNGQCYENLGEMSGIDVSSYQSDIEAAACSLRDALPQEYRNDFKVFDFGYYTLNESMGEVDAIWDAKILESQSKASYYVLFGKLSNSSGIYNSYRVSVSMPPILDEGCADNLSRKIAEIESILSSGTSPYSYVNKAVESLEVLETFGTCEICDNYDEDGNPIDDDGDGFANCDDFDCLYLQLSSNLKGGLSDLKKSSMGCVVLTQEELDIFSANEDYIVGFGYESSAEVLEEIEAIGLGTCLLAASVSVVIDYGAFYIEDHLTTDNFPLLFSSASVSQVFSNHGFSITGNALFSCGAGLIPISPKMKRYLNYATSFGTAFIDAFEREYKKHDDGITPAETIITEKMDWSKVLVHTGAGGLLNVVLNEAVQRLTPHVSNLWNSNKGKLIDKFDRDFRPFWNKIKEAFNLNPPNGLAAAVRFLRTKVSADKWDDFLDDFGNSVDDLNWFKAQPSSRIKAYEEAVERGVKETLRKNRDFLHHYGKIIDNVGLQNHIFMGNINNVTGCHYRPAVDGVNIRFLNNAVPEGNSLGVLKGDIEMLRELLKPGRISFDPPQYKWTLKVSSGRDPQTFFPPTWSQNEILEMCASALANPNKSIVDGRTRMWVAESESGVFIRWFDDFSSIFPKF